MEKSNRPEDTTCHTHGHHCQPPPPHKKPTCHFRPLKAQLWKVLCFKQTSGLFGEGGKGFQRVWPMVSQILMSHHDLSPTFPLYFRKVESPG